MISFASKTSEITFFTKDLLDSCDEARKNCLSLDLMETRKYIILNKQESLTLLLFKQVRQMFKLYWSSQKNIKESFSEK